MGRITIFYLPKNQVFENISEILTSHKIPYSTISLEQNPQRRKDMYDLCHSYQIPQVFSNNTYIGSTMEEFELNFMEGLKRLQKQKSTLPMDQTGAGHGVNDISLREVYLQEIGNEADPSDPRLALSPATNNENNNQEELTIMIPFTSKTYTVPHLTLLLMQVLVGQENEHNGTTFKKSFIAKAAIERFMQYFHFSNKEEAIQFGQQLQHYQIIHSCGTSKRIVFSESSAIFQLQPFHTPHIMNSFMIYTPLQTCADRRNTNEDLFQELLQIYQLLCKLEQNPQNQHKFQDFNQRICKLQALNIYKLKDAHDDEKIAFFINLYNILYKIAHFKIGIPIDSMHDRQIFYSRTSINIGGFIFSLEDILHGVLRCNNKRKNQFVSGNVMHIIPFQEGDDRKLFIPITLNPRIHFAILHTPIATSEIPFYFGSTLNDMLQVAAFKFCEQFKNVFIAEESFTLNLSKIFKWFDKDFALDEISFCHVLLDYTRGEKRKKLQRMIQRFDDVEFHFHYMPFDWESSNGSVTVKSYKKFDKNILFSSRNSFWGHLKASFFMFKK